MILNLIAHWPLIPYFKVIIWLCFGDSSYWHEQLPLGGRLATMLVATISPVIFFFLLLFFLRRDLFS